MTEKTTVATFLTQRGENLTMSGCPVLPTVSTKAICFVIECASVALLSACFRAAKSTELLTKLLVDTAVVDG